MKDKKSWFLKVWDDANPEACGWGECGPLPGLSPEEFDTQRPLLELLTQSMNQENWTIDHFVPKNPGLAMLRRNLTDHFPAFLFQRKQHCSIS